MSKLTLYVSPISQPSRAVLWYLNKNKAQNKVLSEVEIKHVDFQKKENRSAEYTAMNPYHSVPMLRVDGKTLVESGAILTYLASLNDNKDVPTDPWQKAKMNEAMLFHESMARKITMTWVRHIAMPKALKAPLTLEDAKATAAKSTEELTWILKTLDDRLGENGGFSAGPSFSLADYILACELTQLPALKCIFPEGFALENFENVSKFLASLSEMDGYKEFVGPVDMMAGIMAAPWYQKE